MEASTSEALSQFNLEDPYEIFALWICEHVKVE